MARASTSDGDAFAFGGCEEALRTKVLGHEARGGADEQALDRRTGIGRVGDKDGDYADALAKGHGVHLLVLEESGAMNGALVRLSKGIGLPDVHDTTVYDTARASPTSFYTHHQAAISAAVGSRRTRCSSSTARPWRTRNSRYGSAPKRARSVCPRRVQRC